MGSLSFGNDFAKSLVLVCSLNERGGDFLGAPVDEFKAQLDLEKIIGKKGEGGFFQTSFDRVKGGSGQGVPGGENNGSRQRKKDDDSGEGSADNLNWFSWF